MACMGCRSSAVNLDETWTQQGSLSRNNWNPFNNLIAEGFQGTNQCSTCKSNQSIKALSWTDAGQVAPNKYQIWNKMIVKNTTVPCKKQTKENYQETAIVNTGYPGQYLPEYKTWGRQGRYETG